MEEKWNQIKTFFEKDFGAIDLEGILFIIGVQELGMGHKKLPKDQKLDVLHIAVCTLLEPYGYYEFEGKDKDGWPHWKRNEKLPFLKSDDQQILMKEAIIEYVESNEIINLSET